MANNKSAEKRIQIAERNRLRNRVEKSRSRTLIKKFLQDLEVYQVTKKPEDKEKLEKILSSIYKALDKATRKNVFHKNTAARKKAKLAACLKAA